MRQALGVRRVEFFDPAQPGTRPRLAGDRVHPDEYEVPGLTYNFRVPRASPRDVYLRVRTSGPVSVQTQLVEPDENAREEARLATASSLFVAAEFALFALALFNWWFHDDRLSGLYALAQFAIICSAATRLGLLRMALGSVLGTALDPISALSFFAIGLFGLAFGYRLLQQCVRMGWSFNLLRLLFAAWVAVFALYFAGWRSEALRTAVPLLMLGLLAPALVAAIEKPLPPDPIPPIPRWVLCVVYVLLAFFTLPPSTPGLSAFLNPGEGSFPPFVLAGLGGAALILALIVQRRRRQENAMKTLAVKAEAERAQRVEQSNFVAMLAHELNSPLTVIGALADANTRRAEPGNLPAAAASAIDEMRAVIDKCVQATRVEEAGLVLAHEECDVRALIHASSVHLASDRFHVDVRAETDTWVESDPAVLTTIVSNLLENALKYGAPGTPVDVVVHGASQGDVPGLAVRVTNPCGPAGAPDADRVFQKFYRGDGAGAFRGSGLGLFISSKLAAMLGGALSLETAQGAVTFALWVPARRNMT